jgi:hypothetical protein
VWEVLYQHPKTSLQFISHIPTALKPNRRPLSRGTESCYLPQLSHHSLAVLVRAHPSLTRPVALVQVVVVAEAPVVSLVAGFEAHTLAPGVGSPSRSAGWGTGLLLVWTQACRSLLVHVGP